MYPINQTQHQESAQRGGRRWEAAALAPGDGHRWLGFATQRQRAMPARQADGSHRGSPGLSHVLLGKAYPELIFTCHLSTRLAFI